ENDVPSPRASALRRLAWLVPVLLALWVQRRALGSFFAADDLIHLEQARAILPTLLLPWRALTQVLYFRGMLALFGPAPAPFLLVGLLLHAIDVGLLFALALRLTRSRSLALLAAGLFGVHPLALEVLFRAVGINETASCAFALGAALCFTGPRPRAGAGTALFVLGLFCKESILGLPLALAATSWFTGGGRSAIRRVLPAAGIALAGIAVFVVLRARGLAPSGAGYAVHLGGNVFHNAMTYLLWALDWAHPLPDLVRSFDPHAWSVALPALAVLLLFAWRGPQRNFVRWGFLWWAAALLPVLALENATYGYYAYASLAGLATAIAAAVSSALEWIAARGRFARAARGAVPVLVLAIAALRADSLEAGRLRLALPGSDLPLDPLLRGIEVPRRAVLTMGNDLPQDVRRAVVFSPPGLLSAYGARSGRAIAGAARGRAYLYLEAVLDSGRALRVFYPQLDSVRVLRAWSAPYRDWSLYVQTGNGYLQHIGAGPGAHAHYARDLLAAGFGDVARDYLGELVTAFPSETPVRFLYGAALARTGDAAGARAQLEQVIRAAPDDTLARLARRLLVKLPGPGGR
ncbi:MAG TPA: tetratricopeptide repeat protein, partial [Terriglobales bacterium]|nr:tetratricopeptide repeat protein [Terriglobales bacterium]